MALPRQRPAVVHRKETRHIWEGIEAATAGVAAAHEIVHLLEKDNAIFGVYLEQSALKEAGDAAPVVEKKKEKPASVFELGDMKRSKEVALSARETEELEAVCRSMRTTVGKQQEEEKPKKLIITAPPSLRFRSVASVSSRNQSLESPRSFQALPLPSMYGGSTIDEAHHSVATRTVDWYRRKQAERVEAREARRTAALAALQPAPDLGDSKKSWQAAKLQAAKTADALAADEALRRHAKDQSKAWKRARDAAKTQKLQEEIARLRSLKVPPPRPRPEAPVDRPTKASLAATGRKPDTKEEATLATDKLSLATRPFDYSTDPYAGIEPLKLDPRVLAIIGEDEPVLSPVAKTSFVDRVANHVARARYDRQSRPSPSEHDDDQDQDDDRPEDEPEEGEVAPPLGFFDILSSSERGRKQCRDPRLFQPASMQRVAVEPGVVMLTGVLVDPPHTELAICVLFDRHRFSEAKAMHWWTHRGKYLCGDRTDEEDEVFTGQPS